MKKILFLFLIIITSFSLFSCGSTKDKPFLFQTSYKEIFSHFNQKSYAFSETKNESFSEKISDDINYTIEYEDSNYIITLNYNSTIFKLNYDDTFSNIYYLNDKLYLIHYKFIEEDETQSNMIISEFYNDNFVDVFQIESCQEGYNTLKYEDDLLYVYYYNSKSGYLTYAQIAADYSNALYTQLTKASYIRAMSIKNHNEFYYIDGTTLYYFKNSDDQIDYSDITFIASEVTYLYETLDKLSFYEVKATSYLVSKNLLIREIEVSREDNKFSTELNKIYDVNYNLRNFDYITYKNKILFIFYDFLGIIEYDIDTNTFYSYYDYSVEVDSFIKQKDTLLIHIKKKDTYYNLDLNNI